MDSSREVDWVAAWYEIYAVYDATVNFWISATFAVVVAVHFLGAKATRDITIPIAIFYSAFSLWTALRVIGIGLESAKVIEELSKPDIDFFSHYVGYNAGYASDNVLTVTFLVGTAYTIYFVLTAHKRHGN